MGVAPVRVAFNYIIGGLSRWMPPCYLKNLFLKHVLGVGFGPKMSASVNLDCIIDPWRPDLIEFGDGVFLGWGSRLLSHRIIRDGPDLRFDFGPIIVKDGAFIGGWALIEGDTVVGEGSTVASMAILPWGKRVPDHETAKATGVVARWGSWRR